MGGVVSRFFVFPEGQEPTDSDNVTVEELQRAVEVTDWGITNPEVVFTYSPETNPAERVFQDLQDAEDFTWNALVGLAHLVGQGES